MRFLLDANLLIALTDIDHVSHSRATSWARETGKLFATCPITQGALIRFIPHAKGGITIRQAKQFLTQLISLEGHRFWPDAVSYEELPEKGIIRHKQVTDAYLVALARHHGGQLATLDRALAALHAPTVVLV